jgi:hypothetical protein
MKGEFRGDFSRDTFDPSKHFLRVLMQQGRVSLDADWNEQTDILLHYMQTLARDLIGPYAGPEDEVERGFGIAPTETSPRSFSIGRGRYYVDGILCENGTGDSICKTPEGEIGYYTQPDFPRDVGISEFQTGDLPLLVYLDVWERHISYIEDDYIREKALGMADTASRSRVVWQVKALKSGGSADNEWIRYAGDSADGEARCNAIRQNWIDIVKNLLQNPNRGCLKARAKQADEVPTDPCITPPESSYRGEENQLYRVEIHRGGSALNEEGSNKSEAATFKWSRDNGTVAFPIIFKSGNTIVLEHLGRDNRMSLKKGDWVEVVDDDYTLLIQSRPSPLAETRPLAQVDNVDMTEMMVTLRLQDSSRLPDYPKDSPKHPLLRRWDHKKGDLIRQDEPKLAGDGALIVEEGSWITVEEGIQIWFEKSSNLVDRSEQVNHNYQTGDYWLVPARTATGDVEWPRDAQGAALILPPHGIDHHYAPLAIIGREGAGSEGWIRTDCRCVIRKTLHPPCGEAIVRREQ